MINRILVPIDGSENANKAPVFACHSAEKFDGDVFLLHAADPPAEERYLAMGSSIASMDAARRAIEESGQQIVDNAIAVVESHQCKPKRSDVVIGDATEEILLFSKQHLVDAIVIGSRGLSTFSNMLLGSVSHKVGNLAECTCVTVR